MPPKTEIIEAVARTMDVPHAYVNLAVIEATLDAMLPLLKALIASKVRAQKRGINDWNDDVREQVAQLIERFEL